MFKFILNQEGVSALDKHQQQVITGGGTCTLTANDGTVVVVPDRDGDPGYCKRLCDNAPGCADVE